MAVRYLWFDIGYTLLYTPREQSYRTALAELGHDLPLERLEREFHVADKHFMRERPGVFGHDPETFMPWFLGELNYRLGIRVDLSRLWERLKQLQPPAGLPWIPFDRVPDALAGLRNGGYRLGVISNWDRSARTLLAACGLEQYFEHIVISCEVGIEKPDPRIFQLALQRAGVSPAECLYVGDNYYDDSVGARTAGMGSLILNRFGSLGVEEIRDQPILRDISEVASWLEDHGGAPR